LMEDIHRTNIRNNEKALGNRQQAAI